jgi:hypothetical protein
MEALLSLLLGLLVMETVGYSMVLDPFAVNAMDEKMLELFLTPLEYMSCRWDRVDVLLVALWS